MTTHPTPERAMTSERIDLPSGWYFSPVKLNCYRILFSPSATDMGSWLDSDARAFAATLQQQQPQAPAGGEWQPSQGTHDILDERRRQIEAEGWTPEHDNTHVDGAMAWAAACYAIRAKRGEAGEPSPPWYWPWPNRFWKRGSTRRMLVKAGALIIAEIERLDRAAAQTPDQGRSE